MAFGKGKKMKVKVTEAVKVVRQGPKTMHCIDVIECSKKLRKHKLTANTHEGRWDITVKPRYQIERSSIYANYYYGITLTSKKDTLELIDALAEAAERMS